MAASPSIEPFLNQIRRDLGDNRYVINQIESGLMRPHRDGVDITEEAHTEAKKRADLAEKILQQYA